MARAANPVPAHTNARFGKTTTFWHSADGTKPEPFGNTRSISPIEGTERGIAASGEEIRTSPIKSGCNSVLNRIPRDMYTGLFAH